MKSNFSSSTMHALRSLSLAYFVQATGALSVIGSLEPISREWSLADSQSAYLISVFGVTFAIAAPLLQVYFGHMKRRRQVLLGLGVFSMSSLLFAAAPNYTLLLLARVMMGLGAAFIGPVLGALGSSLVEREQQGSAIATVLLGLSVAGLVGIPAASWLAHAWGARFLFVAVGIAGIGTAFLIAWLVPDHGEGERIRLGTMLSLLTEVRSLNSFLVAFFIASGVYSTYAFISPIIREVYHAGPDILSLSLTVLGIAGVIGNLFVTRAARRHSAEKMLVAGIAMLAVDILFMWVFPHRMGWLFFALTVWAFATDVLWPSQQRRIVERTPHLRGIALALTSSFVFCGIGFGSAVAGWMYPLYGYGGALGSSLLFLGLAVGSLLVSEKSAKADLPTSAAVPCR